MGEGIRIAAGEWRMAQPKLVRCAWSAVPYFLNGTVIVGSESGEGRG